MAVESTKSNPTTASPDRAAWPVGGPALVTLMVLQIIIGYEWLSSGITKIASGDFVSGLGADLTEESGDAAHWYHSFLESTIIPNARTFAVLIEVGEVSSALHSSGRRFCGWPAGHAYRNPGARRSSW